MHWFQKNKIDDITNCETCGFVAKNVEPVLPCRVIPHNTEFIPNHYEICDVFNTSNIQTKKTHNFIAGDKIAFKNEDNLYNYDNLEVIDASNFIIDGIIENDNLFCIGKEVSDFLRINILSIQAVEVSAIQELDREFEKQQTIIDD